MKKCVWSNQKSEHLEDVIHGDQTYVVLPRYKVALENYLKKIDRYRFAFQLYMLFFILSAVLFQLLPAPFIDISMTILFLSLAFVTFIFPFATPQTVQMVGIARSLKWVRFLSVLIVAIALLLSLEGLG